MKNKNGTLLQAKILGRVERLLGKGKDVNLFSEASPQGEAFLEGWSRALDDPIALDAGLNSREQPVEKEKIVQKRMSAKMPEALARTL